METFAEATKTRSVIESQPRETRQAAGYNAARCDVDALAGHVESYFLKLNDRDGRRALWIKATVLVREGGVPSAPQLRVAEAWAIAFDRSGHHVAVKETHPLTRARGRAAAGEAARANENARFSRDGLAITVGDLRISPGRVVGAIGKGDRRITCDLRFTMDAPPLVPFPSAVMYEARLPSSKLVSPHPDSRFSGSYTVVGQAKEEERIEIDGWRGMQGHNWGTRHAELYAWGHCNQWDGDEELVLEGVTARVKVGPVLAPPMSIVCVRHRGVRYDFNGPLSLVRAHGSIVCNNDRDELRRWSFRAKSAIATVSGELWAETKDFVGLSYENPDGAITYCLNSKIARGRIRLTVRGKPDVEAMTRAAAFEIGTKDPNHGVTMLV